MNPTEKSAVDTAHSVVWVTTLGEFALRMGDRQIGDGDSRSRQV